MKKRAKIVLAIILTFVMVFSLLPAVVLATDGGEQLNLPLEEETVEDEGVIETTSVAPLAIQTGVYGDNLTWSFDISTGELTIFGAGDMKDYPYIGGRPWNNGNTAILDSDAIKSVVISSGITSIGFSAFQDCRNITSVSIPDSVTRIGQSAFSTCISLVNITIPNSVTSIGKNAFSGSKLRKILIPESVVSIEANALGSVDLIDIEVATGNSHYTCINGVLFSKDQTTLIRYPVEKTNKFYTIPDTVTTIWGGAFSYGLNLTKIDIPDSVAYIGPDAFELCKGLTNIAIPDGVTCIEDGTFRACWGLSSITMPDGITSIGNAAFQGCKSLSSITIPRHATELDYFAFSDCIKLANVTIPSGVAKIGYGAFSGCQNLTDIYFEGDAPDAPKVGAESGSPMISVEYIDQTTMHYPASASGWTTPKWNGYTSEPYETTGGGTVYLIDYSTIPGGKISGNYAQANPGTVIEIKVEPDLGKQLVYGSLTYNEQPIYGSSFVMPNEVVTVSAQFEDIVDSPTPPIIFGEHVKWKYKKGFLWVDDTTIPPIPTGSSRDYQNEFAYWANELGYDISGLSLESIINTPVKAPYMTEHNELLFDVYSGKTVQDVMSDILMLGKMQEYLFETEREVNESKNTVEQLNASTKDMLSYMSRYNEYLGKYKDFKYDPMDAIKSAIALEPFCEEILTERLLGNQLGLLEKFGNLTIDLKPEVKSVIDSINSTSDSSKYSEYYSMLDDMINSGMDLYTHNYKGVIKPAIDVLLENNFSRNQSWKNYNKCTESLSEIYDFVKAIDKGSDFGAALALGKVFVKYLEFAGDMLSFVEDQYSSWLFWMNYYVAKYYPEQYSKVGFDNNGKFSLDNIFNKIDSSGTDNLTQVLLSFFNGKNTDNALKLFGAQDAYGMDQEKREILINNATMLNEISQCDFRYAQECLVKYALAAQPGNLNTVRAQVSCPVDIKLLDESGITVFALKNGSEYSQNYNQYCSFYLTGENRDEKTIIYPENYTLSIVPYAAGTMECLILEDLTLDTMSQKNYSLLPVVPGTIYTIKKQGGNGRTELTVSEHSVSAGNMISVPKQLNIQAGQTEMQVGDYQQLSIILGEEPASSDVVDWSSSNLNCVSVDENGVLCAKEPGVSLITATYQGIFPIEATMNIKIMPDPATQHSLSVAVAGNGDIGFDLFDRYTAGEQIQMEAIPGANSSFVEWISSDGTISTNPSLKFVMPDRDFSVTAYFKPNSLSSIPVVCTANSITLEQFPDGDSNLFGEIQYGFSEGETPVLNWQTSPVFENLSPDTAYTFYVRYAGSGTVLPSKASDGTVIKTATMQTFALDITAPVFGAITYGSTQPEANGVSIFNSGNSNATISSVALSGRNASSFVLNKTSGATIAAGATDNATYTIQPVANLNKGSYTAVITVIYDKNATASATIAFTVNSAPQTAPAAPQIDTKTTDSVTLKAIADSPSGAAVEYSKDSGMTWQASPKFTGLSSSTEYSFIARYAATANYDASPASGILKATTDAKSSGGGSGGGSSGGNSGGSNSSGSSTEIIPDNSSNVSTQPDVLPFADVPMDTWYADAVAYVYAKGMMTGTSGTTFSPDSTSTRGMIVTILYRLDGSPDVSSSTFSDVAAGQYYTNAVAWASAKGIVSGYGGGLFGPHDPITREQMAVILYRYAQYKGYDITASADLSSYIDTAQISRFALPALQWANAEGLVAGTSNITLSPVGFANRAQIAAILMRFCENVAK